jgi:hypothetical protein
LPPADKLQVWDLPGGAGVQPQQAEVVDGMVAEPLVIQQRPLVQVEVEVDLQATLHRVDLLSQGKLLRQELVLGPDLFILGGLIQLQMDSI